MTITKRVPQLHACNYPDGWQMHQAHLDRGSKWRCPECGASWVYRGRHDWAPCPFANWKRRRWVRRNLAMELPS